MVLECARLGWLGHLSPAMFGDDWDVVTKRARVIANERIAEAGFKGGFYEARNGEPVAFRV